MKRWRIPVAVLGLFGPLGTWCAAQTGVVDGAVAEAAEMPPPVPEGVQVVVGTAGEGRRAVRPGWGGAVSVGIGTDAGHLETVVWDAAGRVQWRGRTELPLKCPAAVRTPVGLVAWDGAYVAVRPAEWEETGVEEAEVFAWVLEGDGPQFARLAGEAVGTGTNAASFDAVHTGGWWLVRWDDWKDAPGGARLYVVVPKGDADGDGLSDGRESVLRHTDPAACDTDGDTRGDGLEVATGSNPLKAAPDAVLCINALWTDPEGRGRSWIELYCSAPKDVPLDGMRLETARDGAWRTVLAFPAGTRMAPGQCLLVGERGVAGADFTADLGFPARWPSQPVAGARLVWDGAERGGVADAVIVGRGEFPAEGGLARAGWESTAGVRPQGGDALARRYPGIDNNRTGDWMAQAGRESVNAAAVPDFDGDGLSDGDEWSGRRNLPWREPTNPYNADTDGDGLSDGDECVRYRTNPNTWDTDGDINPWTPQGTPVREWPGSDPYEIEHGTDPLVPGRGQ